MPSPDYYERIQEGDDMDPNKRAKTPVQKWEIIIRLFALWLQHPEMRLTQLVRNVYQERDIYHVEDFAFIDSLEDAYKEWDK